MNLNHIYSQIKRMILKISAYFLKYNVAFVKATAFINETNLYSNIKKSNNFKFKKLIQPYRVIFKNLAATLKSIMAIWK